MMDHQLRIPLMAIVLLRRGLLSGPKPTATMISSATGFSILVAMVETGDFALASTLSPSKELVAVRD